MREVVFDGVRYPSVAACARANDIQYSTMRDYLGLKGEQKARPITIRGKRYPSMLAASVDIGVTQEAIRQARNRGTLDTVGFRKFGVRA